MVDGCPMARSLEVSASAIWYMAQRTLVDASVDGSLGASMAVGPLVSDSVDRHRNRQCNLTCSRWGINKGRRG